MALIEILDFIFDSYIYLLIFVVFKVNRKG